MPGPAYGIETPRIVSQRVAPSASAPSERSLGTREKSSRQMLDVIGMIMIVRTSAAGSSPACEGAPLKMGIKPKYFSSNGSRCCGDPRPEDEDAPEPEDHARDRREQLDERSDRPADPARRELGEEERDRDRHRRRDQERDEGGDDGAVDEVERPEILRDGIPRRPSR